MGPHTTLTPKISKISVHLGDMQVPLSTNFLIKTCLLWVVFKDLMILGVPHYEPWIVYVNIHTMVYKKNDYQNKNKLNNAGIQFKLQLKMFQSTKHLVTQYHAAVDCDLHRFFGLVFF